MCDRCREKYLREKRQALKEKTKKTKKKSTPVKQVVPVQILEPHLVMKNNAMFLLDLASAAGLNLPASNTPSGSRGGGRPGRMDSSLPSVSEDSMIEQCPFPPVPFLYLCQRGAHGADSAFADDMIFSDRLGLGLEQAPQHGDHRFTRSESAGDPARPANVKQQQQQGVCTGELLSPVSAPVAVEKCY